MVKVSDRVPVGSVSWRERGCEVEPREDQTARGEGRAERLEDPPEGQGLTILSCWHRGQTGA